MDKQVKNASRDVEKLQEYISCIDGMLGHISLRRYMPLEVKDILHGKMQKSAFCFTDYRPVIESLGRLYVDAAKAEEGFSLPKALDDLAGSVGEFIYAYAVTTKQEQRDKIYGRMADRPEAEEIISKYSDYFADNDDDEDEQFSGKTEERTTAEWLDAMLTDSIRYTDWVPDAAGEMYVGDAPTVNLAALIVNSLTAKSVFTDLIDGKDVSNSLLDSLLTQWESTDEAERKD